MCLVARMHQEPRERQLVRTQSTSEESQESTEQQGEERGQIGRCLVARVASISQSDQVAKRTSTSKESAEKSTGGQATGRVPTSKAVTEH